MPETITFHVTAQLVGSAQWTEAFDRIRSLGYARALPGQITLATGVTDQSPIVVGATGISTIQAVLVHTDTAISVKLGVAASNVAFTVGANGILCLTDTSLTAMSFSNASGATAEVHYLLAGS